MSHRAPPRPSPSTGRTKRRWSLEGQSLLGAASTAGLPGTSAWVKVDPPLLARIGLRMASIGLADTMSALPGLKPRMPEAPSCPNRLKLSTTTVPEEEKLLISEPEGRLPETRLRARMRVLEPNAEKLLYTPPPVSAALPEIVLLCKVRRPWFFTPPPAKPAVLPEIVLLFSSALP